MLIVSLAPASVVLLITLFLLGIYVSSAAVACMYSYLFLFSIRFSDMYTLYTSSSYSVSTCAWLDIFNCEEFSLFVVSMDVLLRK